MPELQTMVNVVAPDAVAPPVVGGHPVPPLISVLFVPPSEGPKVLPLHDYIYGSDYSCLFIFAFKLI